MEMWERGPFFDLDAEEVEKDHKFMYQQSNKLNIIFGRMKVPKPAQVAQQHVNQPLIDFKVYLPIIRALTNPGLKKRHWKMIGTVIEMPINRKMDKKLWELKQINIEKYKDKLEEIADSASKEYSNETILKNMKEAWQDIEFRTKDWKGGSYILEGEAIEEIQTLLDDHIVKTQTMKGSPYAKPFEQEISEWERALLNTQENLDVWLKVQGVWLYLEPVFSSDDILKQMPVEGRTFKEVDRSWRNLMARINAN